MIGAFIAWGASPRGTAGWVIAENGCHIWVGANHNGYGQVFVGGRQGRVQNVNRVRYEREVGPIPEGMELDHFVCDNPRCCNPAHVRPVTPRENSLRSNGASALNRARTHCTQGHALTTDNLLAWELRQGKRICRTCFNTRHHARKQKRALESLLPPREQK